jgi:site-specific recombinase XerD
MLTILDSLPEFMDYLRHEKRCSVATITSYLSDLRCLGRIITHNVAQITFNELRDYQRMLGQQGLKATTVERKFAAFKTFWKWLVLQNYAPENVAERVKLPRRKRTYPRWMSEAEVIKFVSTPVKLRYHLSEMERFREEVAWKMLAWLGLRRSEVLKLRIEDVYLKEGRVMIRSAKGDHDRTLPLPEALRPLLARLIRDRHPKQFVFPGVGKSGQWGKDSFVAAFRSHLKTCGLDNKGITPHTLRHTFGTHLSLRGIRPEVIKELMGHSDIKTTMIYLHVTDADLQKGLNAYILVTLGLE